MADPICRWRNTTPETVRLLVELLPKTEMSEADYKKQLKENCRAKNFDYDKFLTTAYQLAAQIGLYYIDSNGIYHPRFNRVLTDAEANEYVSRVSSLYVSPNPYAKSMFTASSVACLYDLFVQCAGKVDKGVRIDVKKVLEDYYKLPIGNTDMVVNLMVASGSFDKVDGQHIVYRGFDGLANDKERFFNHFGRVVSTVGFAEAMAAADNLREAFIAWMRYCERLSESTINNYIASLDRVSESVPTSGVNRTSGWWAGIYSYLTEAPPPVKTFFEIQTIEELRRYYGAFDLLFADAVNYGGLNPEKYDECRKWAIGNDSKENRRSIKYGYIAYKKFLQWREAHKKSEDKKDEPPPNVDRLSVALKLFAEKRSVDKPSGWSSYDDWTKGVRTEFVAVDEVLLDDSSFDYLAYIRKFGISWQVANTKFAAHSDEEKRAVLKFLKGHKDSPKSASWYIDDANRLVVNGNQVKGMSPKAMLYFMSELHPEEFAAWTEPTYEQLAYLGLHKGAAPSDLTMETYEDCKAKQQLIVAKMKELKIGKASDDSSAPDYRTANEFLWWLGQDDNKNLIKEKVMSKQWKSVNSKDKVKNGTRKLSEALSGNDMLKRLVAALRTKPFAILAGHSGTGKSQLVRRLAYMTCNNELLIKEGEGKTAPGNYCMVQVKPNWHDSTDLLGYYSEMGERHFVNTPFVEFICKAYAYPDTPFFVCLDEMNLAPVEQYFAEYLSAIESMENKDGVWLTDSLVEVDKTGEKDASGKEKVDVEIVDQIMKGAASKEAADWIQTHGLTIPKNLFVVGTVNMDETTCQFSRKVLDRAMTLLMNGVKFSDMAASKKPSEEERLDEAGLDFFLKGEVLGTVGVAESALLDGINEPLANTPFVVAYRFANEYALYEAALAKLNGVNLATATDEEKKKYAMEALDHVVMMKLLPRIHGERGTVRVLFEGGKRGDKNVPGLESKLPSGGLSVDMMKKILERRDEYLTFWP